MAHIVAMAMYSPRKNSRNGVEEYSTANPATSSDSASTRSNGGRLVSASADMKKMTNIGNSGSRGTETLLKSRLAAVWCPTEGRRVEGARQEQHRDEDEADRDLVGHHLRRRAQRGQERVFRVRRPSRHDHAIDHERGDGED